MYPNMLSNIGNLKCYNVYFVDVSALDHEDNEYKGEVYIEGDSQGYAFIDEFTPNKVKVYVNVSRTSMLVLNQNYFSGWKVKDRIVESYRGLVSTRVIPEDNEIIVYYLPDSFIIGFVISGLTFLICSLRLITGCKENQ